MGASRTGPLSICIVAPNAYGTIADLPDHIGGIERMIAMDARELARRGHTTSVVTWRHSPDHAHEIDGVRLLAMCGRDDGVPGLRFLHPRWTSLRSCLERAAADVYITASADAVLGQVVLWCRRNRRPSLFCVGSDSNCRRHPSPISTWRHRTLYRYGLVRADRVVVQTQQQRRMLRREFQRESRWIRPAADVPSPAECVAPTREAGAQPRVVWLGRFSPEKRLEWLLDVAEQRPAIHFDVAGDSNQPTEYSAKLWKRAAGVANVCLHGRLSHAGATELIRSAQLLLCTSAYEGFPNTFLEAWSSGIPVVSTVDPDEVIARHGLGAVAADPAELARALDGLLESPESSRQSSERCRRHFLERHGVMARIDRFESILREMAV